MKKILMSAALATIIFASCTNEEVINQNANRKLFTLEVAQGVDSRTTLEKSNGSYQPKWSAGDQIYVTSKDGRTAGVLTLKNGAGTERAEFEGFVSGNPSALYYSIFPVPTNGVIDLSKRSVDEIDAPMVGTINGGNTTLVNKASIIKLNIIDLPANSTLKISGDEIISSATWNGAELENGSTNEFVISGANAKENIFVPVFVKEGASTTTLNVRVGEGNVVPLTNVALAVNKISVNVPTLFYKPNGELVNANNTTGSTTENGEVIVNNPANIQNALDNGEDVILVDDIAVAKSETGSNGYGATGITQLNGGIIDGNGNAVSVNAWGTWDSAINTTGGTIKNVNVTGGMRGIFINHNSSFNDKVILENVIVDGTIYTISCDQGTNKGLEAYNSTFNGWTSYAATIGAVKFDNCSFGEGQGYAFCRPYAATEFIDCNFAAGYEIDARATVTFENCKLDGVALTAENLAILVTYNISNATIK